ncbi:beta-ketoacyl-[acyl-carrier-protein] synthase family protein [Chlamydiota bacterium]
MSAFVQRREREVVVTGLGVVSSIGIGKDEFWKNLTRGKLGFSKISSFDTSLYNRKRGGEVPDFDLNKFISRRAFGFKKDDVSHLGRASQLALASAQLAIKDSVLSLEHINKYIGIYTGTCVGEAQEIEHYDDNVLSGDQILISEEFVKRISCARLSNVISNYYQFNGPSITITTACAAGSNAITMAYDAIMEGDFDIALAGGADPFSRYFFSGFYAVKALAEDVPRPFDSNRDGLILGEGSAFLVLESLDHAVKRKAPIYARIAGYGLSCDAYHMTVPHPHSNGIIQAMESALDHAQLYPEDIDYINAHGTATRHNDRSEARAIASVFGTIEVPVSSTKSMIGHTLGAASAIESVVTILTITNDVIPPTMNHTDVDPECPLHIIANKAKKSSVNIAMNNAFGFGGNNTIVIFKKYQKE